MAIYANSKMTQNEFFTEYNDLIRGLVYKACKDPDMRDDVYSECVMALLSAETVFDLPKPAQIAYIKRAVETTSYCQKKSLKKSKTYGDLQSDDNDTDPEEYAIPDDRYSPETEHQDLIGRDKALELAEQYKATTKLVAILRKKAKAKALNLHSFMINSVCTTKGRLFMYKSEWITTTHERAYHHWRYITTIQNKEKKK